VLERGPEQVHLRLQQVTLRLGDEETRRQPDVVASPLGLEALLGERRPGARGVDALGGTLNLAPGLAHGFGGLNAKAGDPLCHLPPFDVRPCHAGRLEAATERIAHRHADAPCWKVARKDLSERVTETQTARPRHETRKASRSDQLSAAQAVGAVRCLEAYV